MRGKMSDEVLGGLLRDWRKERGKSLEKQAGEFNISPSTLGNFELGIELSSAYYKLVLDAWKSKLSVSEWEGFCAEKVIQDGLKLEQIERARAEAAATIQACEPVAVTLEPVAVSSESVVVEPVVGSVAPVAEACALNDLRKAIDDQKVVLAEMRSYMLATMQKLAEIDANVDSFIHKAPVDSTPVNGQKPGASVGRRLFGFGAQQGV